MLMIGGATLLLSVGLPVMALAMTTVDPWEAEIREFEVADHANPPPLKGVMFVGSSSIKMWDLAASFPGKGYVNRGFGGSELADATRVAGRIIYPFRPRLVILYAGDNDLAAGKTPARVAADFGDFVRTVHGWLPRTTILFLSIKPSPSRRHLVGQAREANRLIAAAVKQGKRLQYLEVGTALLARDGQLRPDLYLEDGLHLNPKGYEIWTALVGKRLKQFDATK